jgi:hypothetical protein
MKSYINQTDIFDKLIHGKTIYFRKRDPKNRKKDCFILIKYNDIAGSKIKFDISKKILLKKVLMIETNVYEKTLTTTLFNNTEEAISGINKIIKKILNKRFKFIKKEKIIKSLLNTSYSKYLINNKNPIHTLYMRNNNSIIKLLIFNNTINIEQTDNNSYHLTQGIFKKKKHINDVIKYYKDSYYTITDEDLSNLVDKNRGRYAKLNNIRQQEYLNFWKNIPNAEITNFINDRLDLDKKYRFVVHMGNFHKSENYVLSEDEVLLVIGDLTVDGALITNVNSSLLVTGNVNINSFINAYECPIYIENKLLIKDTAYLGERAHNLHCGGESMINILTCTRNFSYFSITYKHIYYYSEKLYYFCKKYYNEEDNKIYISLADFIESLKNSEDYQEFYQYNVAQKNKIILNKDQDKHKNIPYIIEHFCEHYEKYAGFSPISDKVTLKILTSKYSINPDIDKVVLDNRSGSGIYLLAPDKTPYCIEPHSDHNSNNPIDALTLLTRYYNLINYLNRNHDNIHDFESIKKINYSYELEKSFLKKDEYLANYWLFLFSLLTDQRIDEVLSIINNCTVKDEITLINSSKCCEHQCTDFKHRQATLILKTYQDTNHFIELQNAYQFASPEYKLVAVYWMTQAMKKNNWHAFNDMFIPTGSATDAYLNAINPNNNKDTQSLSAHLIVENLIEKEEIYRRLNQIPKNILLSIFDLVKNNHLFIDCYLLYSGIYNNDVIYTAIASELKLDNTKGNIFYLINKSIEVRDIIKQAFNLDPKYLRLYFLGCIDHLDCFIPERLVVDILWSRANDKVSLIKRVLSKLQFYLHSSRFEEAQKGRALFHNIPGNNLELVKSLINIKNIYNHKESHFIETKKCFYQLFQLLPVNNGMHHFLVAQLKTKLHGNEKREVVKLLSTLKFSKKNSLVVFNKIFSIYRKSNDIHEKYKISLIFEYSSSPYLILWLTKNLLKQWSPQSSGMTLNSWSDIFYKICSGIHNRVYEFRSENYASTKQAKKQFKLYVNDLIWVIYNIKNNFDTFYHALSYPFSKDQKQNNLIINKLFKQLRLKFNIHAAYILNAILPDESCHILHQIIWANRDKITLDNKIKRLLFDGIKVDLLLGNYKTLDERFRYTIQDFNKLPIIESYSFYGSSLKYFKLSHEYQLLKEGYLARDKNKVYLEQVNQYKYYKFKLKGNTIITINSKIEGKPQIYKQRYKTEDKAKIKFNKKIEKKINKSYKPLIL